MMVTNSLSARQQVIQTARQWISLNPVYLDTETTGLDRSDEIVEISIVDQTGQVLLDSLVRPSRPIPAAATIIHRITNDMVQKAPAWPILWQQVRPLLIGKTIIAYNSDFDKRMMMQSHARYQMVWRENFTAIRATEPVELEVENVLLAAPRRRLFGLAAAGKTASVATRRGSAAGVLDVPEPGRA